MQVDGIMSSSFLKDGLCSQHLPREDLRFRIADFSHHLSVCSKSSLKPLKITYKYNDFGSPIVQRFSDQVDIPKSLNTISVSNSSSCKERQEQLERTFQQQKNPTKRGPIS